MQTLERLHSELGGKILENRHQHQKLADDMRHVEAVLKMLDPAYNLRPIAVKRRKPNPWFKRGTVYRRAVDVLRVAERPLTSREIAERVLAADNIEEPASEPFADLIGTINSSLRNHDGNGVERTNEGSPARWKLSV